MTRVTAQMPISGVYSLVTCFEAWRQTMTLTTQTPTSTNFIGRLVTVLNDSDLNVVALLSTLGLLATIYFAIHSPAAASLFVNFPD